jgi:hypothetical protein
MRHQQPQFEIVAVDAGYCVRACWRDGQVQYVLGRGFATKEAAALWIERHAAVWLADHPQVICLADL